MSHVNRQNEINALYDVGIMICRFLMLSQMSPQDKPLHDLPVTFICSLFLVIVKRDVECPPLIHSSKCRKGLQCCFSFHLLNTVSASLKKVVL